MWDADGRVNSRHSAAFLANPARVVRSLKALAKRRNTSMEQEIRELLEEYAMERSSVLAQIEASWARQSRRPSAKEIDSWINAGRE